MVELIVRDNAFPSLTATGRVDVVVLEVNTPPVLEDVGELVAAEGSLLSHLIPARDTDIPPDSIRYSLAGSIPEGVAIDEISGRLTWTPTEVQGGTTNILSIVVKDDGDPPLSSEIDLAVLVQDSLPDFALQIGSTNVLSGTTGDIPLVLQSGQDLTDLSLLIMASKPGLDGVNLQPVAPSIGSVGLAPAGTGAWSLTLSAAEGMSLRGDQELARLVFEVSSSEPSKLVRLTPSNMLGTAEGIVFDDGQGFPGNVFIIREQPLLDAAISDQGEPELVIYGPAGRTYQLQRSGSLGPEANWIPVQEFDLDDTYLSLDGVALDSNLALFRVVETTSAGPLNIALDRESQTITLTWDNELPGYVLETSDRLGPDASWESLDTSAMQTLSGSVSISGELTRPVSDGTRFFRLRPLSTE